MPVGHLQTCKDRAKSHTVCTQLINLECSLSLQEYLKPLPSRIDLAITWLILEGVRLRFFHKDLTLGNKYWVVSTHKLIEPATCITGIT